MSSLVNIYLEKKWDYVITVCENADKRCPLFTGNVGKRLHIGFDDPSHATGDEDFVKAEFRRVRDEIKEAFMRFYVTEIGGTVKELRKKQNVHCYGLQCTFFNLLLLSLKLVALFQPGC